MTIYMVRDALTGAWYKRGHGYDKTWVPGIEKARECGLSPIGV